MQYRRKPGEDRDPHLRDPHYATLVRGFYAARWHTTEAQALHETCAGRHKIDETVPFVKITAVEGEHQGDVLDASYDPQKLVFDSAVVWRRQPNRGPGDLEFERVEAAHFSIVLLWERMAEARPMQSDIDKLHRFASVDSVLHRPPKVEVSWGKDAHAIPTFDGVIESLSIRYFGVADGGTPLHAEADVKLEQAVHLRAAT